MPRKAHGSVFFSDGSVFARVVIAPKKYAARSLHGIVPNVDDSNALEWAGTLQELVDALRTLGRSAQIDTALDTAIRVGHGDGAVAGLERVKKSLPKLDDTALESLALQPSLS